MSQSLREIAQALQNYSGVIGAILTVAVFGLGYLLERRSRAIARLGAWHQYRSEIRQFADVSILTMSEVEALCEANPEILKGEFWKRYNDLLARLSALRDQGKLLIPNVQPDAYGTWKTSAYQGLRDRALDCLAGAFYITTAVDFSQWAHNKAPGKLELADQADNGSAEQMRKLREGLEKLPGAYSPQGPSGKGWSCKSAIVEAKRQFVSEAQELLEARKWIRLIRNIAP